MYCQNCGYEIATEQRFCPSCGHGISAGNLIHSYEAAKEDAVTDIYSYNQISDFLKNAKTLETEKYTLQMLINKNKANAQKLNYKESVKQESAESSFVMAFLVSLMYSGILALAISMFLGEGFWSNLWWTILIETGVWGRHLKFIGIAIVFSLCVGVIAEIVVIKKNATLKKKYNNKVAALNNAYNERQTIIHSLLEDNKKLEVQLNEVNITLEKLYFLNVIHRKYCSFVPILTIYEYFEVGKCNSLRGINGAYALFDDEALHNKIIDKLDMVIDRLDRIQQTQYMLYDAIQDANRISSNIADQNMDLLEKQSDISNNTAAIAYNTKCIEENTRISAYVDVFVR